MKFKSNREDGQGHRTPVSPKEPSKTFQLRVKESTWVALMGMSRDKVRKVLDRIAGGNRK